MCFLTYLLAVVKSIFNTSAMEILRPLMPSLASGTAMFVLVVTLAMILPSNLIVLITLLLLALLVYLVILHVTSGGRDVRDALNLVKTMFSGRADATPSSK